MEQVAKNLHHDPEVIVRYRSLLLQYLGIRCVFPASDEDRIDPSLVPLHLNNDSSFAERGQGSVRDQWSARCMIERLDLADPSKKPVSVCSDPIEDVVVRTRFVDTMGLDRQQWLKIVELLSSLFAENVQVEDYSKALSPPQSTVPLSWVPNTNIFQHHPNIAKLIRLLYTNDSLAVVHHFSKHSLLSVSRFHASTTLSSGTLSNTTGLGSKDLRLRFIIYQLLRAVHYLHSRRLCLDSLQPSSIMIDDDMWLSLPIGLSDRVITCLKRQLQSQNEADNAAVGITGGNEEVRLKSSIPKPPGYYQPLTVQWVSGRISNFEYLMAINYGAGRTMVDPLYHPILPWVTDFTTNCFNSAELPSFRDLSMTKFRLSKGDTQLETTYRHSEPPHHIPESLSELTYYIYMARRTPMQVLRRVVRDVFVPEHYPHSMHRIYEWTPDECIPEFYFDTSVFESIHHNYGLPDLEFPAFAPTASDFVKYHREVLESDFVSDRIHEWIDLTFGYCLDGEAAIHHMNVPLKHSLTSSERMGLDTPNVNKNPGFVMLFDRPHPKRQHNNRKTLSHIAEAFKCEKDVAMFDLQNPVLHFDSSSKYLSGNLSLESIHLTQEDLSSSSFGIDELIKLESRAINERSSTGRAQFSKETVRLQALYTNSTAADGSPLSPATSSLRLKKSLSRPLADASLLKLRQADFIDLTADHRCTESINNFTSQTQHCKFAARSGTSIDSCYNVDSLVDEVDFDQDVGDKSQKGVNHSESGLWDEEFLGAVQSALGLLKATNSISAVPEEIKLLQRQDLFALGCMIAELYLGRTLLSRNDAAEIKRATNVMEAAKIAYRGTSGLPLVVRRVITLLLSPEASVRPFCGELLSSCMISSNSTEHPSGEKDLYAFQEELNTLGNDEHILPLSSASATDRCISNNSFVRIEILSDFCSSLFPSYFQTIYSVVGAAKLAPDGLGRLHVILTRLDEISALPLEGINLAMFHLLEVIGDSHPFGRSMDGLDEQSTNFKLAISLLSDYWRFVDAVGSRLGLEATEKLLVPQVVKFFSQFKSTKLLHYIVETPLWNVLALRAGVRCFLKSFLPLLLTYTCSGIMHSMLFRKRVTEVAKDTAPLWSNIEASDKSEWLRNCSPQALQALQYSAYSSICNLADPDALGSGLTTRYIVPSLLSLVGVPNLALSGFESRDNYGLPLDFANRVMDELLSQSSRKLILVGDRSNLSDVVQVSDVDSESCDLPEQNCSSTSFSRDTLEAFINKKANFNAQEMFVVKSLVQLSMKLGELAVSDLILSTVFNMILPDLESQLTPMPKEGVAAAFMEVILLLNGILPMLSPETIQRYMLEPSRLSGSSLPKLLSSWPLLIAWQFLDDNMDGGLGQQDIMTTIENVRLNTVLLELCRLIVSTSMIAGADVCADIVLPHVDLFFKTFVQVFGMLPVESRGMMKAFELGAELYLPLVQLMGAEAFYTGVPNLNPRLEMWLGSIGSSVPPKSPPLPSNIWPEVANETSNQPEKKKGIMQWISGRSKWMSSLTASHHQSSTAVQVSTPVPTVLTTSTTAPVSAATPLPTQVSRSWTDNPVSTSAPATLVGESRKSAIPKDGSSYESSQITERNDRELSTLTPRRPSIKQIIKTPMTSNKDLHLTPTQGTELVSVDNMAAIKTDNEEMLTSPSKELPSLLEDDDIRAVKTIVNQDIELDSIGSQSADEGNDLMDSSLVAESVSNIQTGPDIFKDVGTPLPSKHFPTEESTNIPPVLQLMGSDKSLSGVPIVDNNGSLPSPRVDDGVVQSMSTSTNNTASISASNRLYFGRTGTSSSSAKKNPYTSYQKLMHGKATNKTCRSSIRKPHANRRSSTTKAYLYSGNVDVDNPDDAEQRELKFSEMAWLLAGNGRWNVEKEMRDRVSREQNKLLKGGKNTMFYVAHNEWNPAAQLSMTTPKIVTDVAGDTGSFINFQLQSSTQWKLEDTPGLIRCMVANVAESLLMTCSRTAVRLWSLTNQPLQHVASYTGHSLPPFNAAFMRTNQHAMTCDGSVHVWDIESRQALSIITPTDRTNGFSFASVIPSKFGVHPSIDAVGDEQILCTVQDNICYYDVRSYQHTNRSIHRVAEWVVPQIPPPQGNFITSTMEALQLTCAASHEHYVFAGSSAGGLWVLDRRMGKVLYSWQGHDGPILKINPLSERHFLAVSERSAAVWEYISDPMHTPSSFLQTMPSSLNSTASILTAGNTGDAVPPLSSSTKEPNGFPASNTSSIFHAGLGGIGDVRRSLNIKSTSDGVYSPSNLILTSFDSGSFTFGANLPNSINGPGGVTVSGGGIRYGGLERDIGLSSKPQHVLYCLSGHKLFSGFLPTFDVTSRDRINLTAAQGRETNEFEELKLSQSYFNDRKGVKLTRGKLQVTSAVLLPLRRLILLGTEDGLVRVVS